MTLRDKCGDGWRQARKPLHLAVGHGTFVAMAWHSMA